MEEEDCPKTRIFSGFFGFPRFRVSGIRRRWNACISQIVVLTTLSCVRFTAVFPGFLREFRIPPIRRTERAPLCEPRWRASPRAGGRSSHGAMKNVSARRQMMDPVSQAVLKPPMSRAIVEMARARWHVVRAQRRARPGPGALINLGRWARSRRAVHDRRLSRVSGSMRLLLHRDRSSCIITEQKTRLCRMIEKGLGAR